MTSDRDCENCVYARPYGGENDNGCSSWDCDYMDRREATPLLRRIVKCFDCEYGDKVESGMICTKFAYYILGWDEFCSMGKRRAD